MFSSKDSLELHLASLHDENDAPNDESPSPVTEPTNIKCDQCSFDAVDVQALLIHVQNDHTEEPCQHCDYVANDRDNLKDHMYEKHENVIMVHTMAQQMNQISESFSLFETFKNEISDVLSSLLNNQNNILHNQNSMKQEMFLIRNKQLEQTKPSQPTEEPVPAGSSPQSSGHSCPPSASADQSPQMQSKSKTGNNTRSSPCAPKKVPKPPQKPKSLYIGDSISSNIDVGALEEATQTQFVTAAPKLIVLYTTLRRML